MGESESLVLARALPRSSSSCASVVRRKTYEYVVPKSIPVVVVVERGGGWGRREAGGRSGD
jgi:hypothetical protein